MLVSSKVFFPIGSLSSGVRSWVRPLRHLTNGIGEPTATHVKFKLAPNITSFIGCGGIENWGGTRRTAREQKTSRPLDADTKNLTFDVEQGRLGVIGADCVFRHAFVLAVVFLFAVSDLQGACRQNLRFRAHSLRTVTYRKSKCHSSGQRKPYSPSRLRSLMVPGEVSSFGEFLQTNATSSRAPDIRLVREEKYDKNDNGRDGRTPREKRT